MACNIVFFPVKLCIYVIKCFLNLKRIFMCFNACQFPMKNYSVNYILFVFFFL